MHTSEEIAIALQFHISLDIAAFKINISISCKIRKKNKMFYVVFFISAKKHLVLPEKWIYESNKMLEKFVNFIRLIAIKSIFVIGKKKKMKMVCHMASQISELECQTKFR